MSQVGGPNLLFGHIWKLHENERSSHQQTRATPFKSNAIQVQVQRHSSATPIKSNAIQQQRPSRAKPFKCNAIQVRRHSRAAVVKQAKTEFRKIETYSSAHICGAQHLYPQGFEYSHQLVHQSQLQELYTTKNKCKRQGCCKCVKPPGSE